MHKAAMLPLMGQPFSSHPWGANPYKPPPPTTTRRDWQPEHKWNIYPSTPEHHSTPERIPSRANGSIVHRLFNDGEQFVKSKNTGTTDCGSGLGNGYA